MTGDAPFKTTNQVTTMAATERLFFPTNTQTTHPMTTSPPFPPAAEGHTFKVESLRQPAMLELERRRAMPPAFYQHTPPAPVRPDLLSSKPRLISARKEKA